MGYWRSMPPPGVQLNRGNPLTKGLLYCFPMGEGVGGRVLDLSRRRMGSLSAVTWGRGVLPGRKGPVFNGSSSFISVAAPQYYDDISVSFWFYATGTWDSDYWPGNANFATMGTSGAGSNDWVIGGGSNSGSNTGQIFAGWGPNAIGSDCRIFSTRTGLNDGRPHHVTWTRRPIAGQSFLYIDGKLDSSNNTGDADTGTSIVNADRNLEIGGDNFSPGAFVAGGMQMFMLHNRALSRAEVQRLYDDPFDVFAAPVWVGKPFASAASVTEAEIMAALRQPVAPTPRRPEVVAY